ncbi:MAG: 4-hydroxythreonine-4-phosphate dehydrogenase PdxA [Myxococcales bacterium]|nr:4-hydroxythreonine-4-phosphate dehydrogenase PdxA [Myxococcales bacterium]
MTRALPRIALTLGDPAGIGPEILAKLLAREHAIYARCIPVVVGDARVMAQAASIAGVGELELATLRFDGDSSSGERQPLAPGRAYLVDLENIAPEDYALGKVGAAAGRAAGEFIARAIELALAGHVDAVVTNPIHKESFILGAWGKRYPGHTEMFSDLCGARRTCMMLACGALRVCHVTTHVSLLDALTKHIKRERIAEVIGLAHDACRALGIAAPRIGVAGVNPHAGEDAMFGDEEQREIAPAIADARARGIDAEGPIAADTLFSKAVGGMYDAVVAMYHDQGHIPVKLAGFKYDHQSGQWDMRGVNVTLGLPIIRTSVDHGTAFDKAGKGVANHESLLEALDYAVALATGSAPVGDEREDQTEGAADADGGEGPHILER